jgi:hypothetical protein
MKDLRFVKILVLMALAAFLPALLFGQAVNFAQIQGRVTDPNGAAIPNAKLTVTQTDTGLVRTVNTNSEGNYIFPRLPVGPYLLQVSASGFKDYAQSGIVLQVGEQPTINVTMTLGTVTEKVEVNAAAALVETNDNSVSEVIDNQRILDLPLNGRQASQLVMLSGAATNPTLSGQDLISSKNYGNGLVDFGSVNISVAGSQENANNYLLDGGDNNDAFSNVNLPFPFPDAIQEFNVQESLLSAQYGVHAGAAVNVVTKSGTNNIHGDAFEFLRNGAVNALPYAFTSSPTYDTLKRNQFGGTVGGPIIKDKLFAFLGYQGTYTRSLANPTTSYVPTDAELGIDGQGVTVGNKTYGNWAPRETGTTSGCEGYTSSTTKFKDPIKGGTKFATTGSTAWLVPTSMYDPAALNLLQYLPTSTDPCGLVSYQIPNNYTEHQGISRVDWNVSPQQTLFFRYFISNFEFPVAFDTSNILETTTPGQDTRDQSVAFGDTYTFSSGIVNSIHGTFTRLRINRGPAGDMINPTDVGIQVPSPIVNAFVLSGPFSIEGGSSTPGHFNNNTFQGSDDVNLMHGKHQIAFGVEGMRYELNYLSTYQSNGQINIGGNYSGDNMLDFLLGDVKSIVQSNNEAENWRQSYFGLYINDNYRLKPNLTVNAGIRWDPYFPAADAFHRGSHFDLASFEAGTTSEVYSGAPAGLFFCGDTQTPCSYMNSHLTNFGPRVGLVWDPKGDGKQSLRTGFGIFYDNPEIFFMDRFADDAPYGAATTLTLAGTADTLSNPYLNSGFPTYPIAWPTASNAFFPHGAYGTTASLGGGGVYLNVPLNMHPTTVDQWNLSYERQFGANWLVSATYLGSHTSHIWIGWDQDPACPIYSNGVCSLGNGSALPTFSSPNAPAGSTSFAPATGNAPYRQYLYMLNAKQGSYFTNMITANDGATASYNGLLLTAKHRFSQNFTVLSNFTYSHCISDGDFLGEATNSKPIEESFVFSQNALRNETSNCGFDIRKNFNTSLVVTSPKYEGLKGKVLNDWQFAPLLGYRSGQWYSVTQSVDNALTVGGSESVTERAQLVGDPNHGSCTVGGVTYNVGTIQCYFNTGAFALAPTGTIGNSSRNMLQGPGAFTMDASLSRSFKVWEGQNLTLRFEAFNVLNHPNFANPNTTCGGTYSFTASSNPCTGSAFGQIQSSASGTAGNPRIFQAAVKYTF